MFEKTKEKIGEVTNKKQEKKLKKIGSLRPQRGHTLYKVDNETFEISEAKIETPDTIAYELYIRKKSRKFVRPTTVSKKVMVEEGYSYFSALNVKNVIKKMKQQVDPELVDARLALLKAKEQ